MERAQSVIERYAILQKAAKQLGFGIDEKDFPSEFIGKHYFWSQQQIKVSGIGAIDYRRIYDNSTVKPEIKGRCSYLSLKEVFDDENDGRKVAIAATVAEYEEKKLTSKKTGQTEPYCKLVIQQNNDLCECVVWPEEFAKFRGLLKNAKNKLIIFSGVVKYSDYTGKNNIWLSRSSKMEII